MSTKTQTPVKLTKKELQQKDQARAEELMKAYASLKKDEEALLADMTETMRPFKERYDNALQLLTENNKERIESLKTSIDSAKQELIRIGDRNKTLFVDDNWHFEDADGHYLHVSKESKVVLSEEFSLPKFIRKMGQGYFDLKWKIKELKKIFTDGDKRGKFTALGLDMKNDEIIEIKQKAESRQ